VAKVNKKIGLTKHQPDYLHSPLLYIPIWGYLKFI
jgi:hypothetical protein